jgi:hypothetical protein
MENKNFNETELSYRDQWIKKNEKHFDKLAEDIDFSLPWWFRVALIALFIGLTSGIVCLLWYLFV